MKIIKIIKSHFNWRQKQKCVDTNWLELLWQHPQVYRDVFFYSYVKEAPAIYLFYGYCEAYFYIVYDRHVVQEEL